MCFVLLLLILSLENAIDDWLSVKMGIGVKSCLKSFPSLISHIPSADANEPATTSDSIVDLLTQPCFFDA
jgi:hypothetical protein